MSHFQELAFNPYYPHIRDPPFLDDYALSSPYMAYLQDMTGTDSVYRQLPQLKGSAHDKYETDKGSQLNAHVEDSIFWPKSAFERKTALPYATALGAGILIGPVFDPTITIGASVVFGYVVGIATNLAMLSGTRVLHVETQQRDIVRWLNRKTATRVDYEGNAV